MKTFLITTAAATLLLSGVTLNTDHSQQNDNTSLIQNNETKLQDYTEYEVLNEKVNIQKYQTKVETDNKNTRILIMSDDEDQEKYKSIFIKDTNRLKIIEFKRGLIFNEELKK
ncbi:hypothetical protein [Terribacillus saccharophilus]|uniref:Uncharacterized protein n=1 Tax=Terribacillus saccharophilus TaxID=361277 RepID=A0ABX4GWE1_9BACI|nr:hypothetical protein [Terribacillus saccharophilus]PAD34868.1 hypothetical protein CHH56_12155 [Terribacillus saccharophilus]PAD95616.1 hypothetical protein CHH50_12390 [Terribacillus saccharophilus]PAD99194.1 hypothetical protein CHH48_13285 [Terribacillus saccharophilus]